MKPMITLTIRLDSFENETLALSLALALKHLQMCGALAKQTGDQEDVKLFKQRHAALASIAHKLLEAATVGKVSQDTDADLDELLKNIPPGSMLN